MDGSVNWKIFVVVGLIVVFVPSEDFIAVEARLTILRLLMLMLSVGLLWLREASNATPSTTADATTILIASLATAAVVDGIDAPRLMMATTTITTRSLLLLLAAEAGIENRPSVE